LADVYRFLATPRWIGFCLGMVVLAGIMVWLGLWQLDRYHQRAAVNHRIDASENATPVPLSSVLRPQQPTARSLEWTRVTVTGSYDQKNEILIRGRTLDATVGFEVLTPLVMADGSAVLIDRGWLPPAAGGARSAPSVPSAPSGPVTVSGRLRLPESRPTPVTVVDGRLDTRRISPPALADRLPYPVYSAYVQLDRQTPAADPAFKPMPASHEWAWLNAGYVVQWWMFAALTLAGLLWAIRRENHRDDDRPRDRLANRPKDRAAEQPALL
jgi:cytochrome oxidase assembly protein ShyY1